MAANFVAARDFAHVFELQCAWWARARLPAKEKASVGGDPLGDRDTWHPASSDALQLGVHPWRVWLVILVRARKAAGAVLPIDGLCAMMAEAAARDTDLKTADQRRELVRVVRWVVGAGADDPSSTVTHPDLQAAFAYRVQNRPKALGAPQQDRCDPLDQPLVRTFHPCGCSCFSLHASPCS